MKTPRTYILLSFLFLLLLGCKQSLFKQKEMTDEEARKYIAAYTQGMIKENAPIEFRFSKKQHADKMTLQNALLVSPAFEYTLQIDSLLNGFKIIPKKPLKRGASYEVELRLKKIFHLSREKILISKIKVFDQFVAVQREGLVFDDQNKSYIRLYVTTAITESKEKILKLFNYPAHKLHIEVVSETEFYVNLFFNPINDQSKTVNWDGKSIGAKEKGTIDIWNYNEDEFNVISTYFNRSTNEYKVYFTKLLDEKQDAKGLIRLGKEDAEFEIKNNIITIFIKTNTRENVNLSINRGIKARDQSMLPLDLAYDIEIAVVKPEIQWVESGTYIPSTGEFKIPFLSKALKSVIVTVVAIPSENASRYAAWNNMSDMDEMEMIRYGSLVHKATYDLETLTFNNLENWNEFGLDLTEMFKREKGTIYRISLSFGPANTILKCEDAALYEFEKQVVDEAWFEDQNRYYDYYNYYDYEYKNDPCHVSYYLGNNGISTNVHCTNVFPIIKKGEKELHIAIKELLNNKVANGAKVDVLSLQGLDVASKMSSSNGVCSFKNLKRDPKAIRVTYKGEVSYFNLQDGEENPLTEFDISSNVRDVDNRIFVYTERDVWRPGDTIFLDVMLNRANFQFEAGLPIVVKLKNPKNVLCKKYLLPIKDGQSIYSFKMPTHLEAPTGYWNASIDMGPLHTSKTLRVETIKPNVVDLMYHFSEGDDNWIYNSTIKGEVEVNYLAGYAMNKGTVSASANIFPVYTPFDQYKNFVFRPYSTVNPVKDATLWSVKTNTEGKADFSFSQDFKNYLGVSKIVIDSKIDLPGGGLNTETESHLVSPFSSYVGIEKAKGKGWRGSFRYGETPGVQVIRLDKKGELIKDNATIHVQLFKYQNDWWYDRYRLSRGHRSHTSWRYDEVWEEDITLKNGIWNYTHDTKTSTSGMYKLVITDQSSGHISEYQFHSVVAQNYSVQSNPMFIDLDLAKDNYQAGENIEISFPTIKDAQALISIERGGQVIDLFWHDLNRGTLAIPVQDGWFPNIYLNVSIVQNYGQKNNDRPKRMYTVKKIIVNQPKNKIEPTILAADKIEPNKIFTFNIKEQNGQPMEYTIALVDMGLLNLTGFRTPNPLAHFSKMIALRVSTWDIFQQLIYYMNPSFAGVFSIGGDESAQKALDESADFNRFKPVVFHLGSFHLAANGKQKHRIAIPNYIGKLKLMVVACNNHSFGHADKKIRVVSPLMVQSQLPRTLNVTDKVDVPITIFKDEPSVKNVQITAKSSNKLIHFSSQKMTKSLADSDQSLGIMQFTTGLEAGTTEITFEGRANGFTSHETTEIFINYPNSYADQQELFKIEAGKELKIPIESFGFDKTKHVDLQVSGALIPNFTKHYHNLIQYPYGCLEQTTSRAIAMLHIEDLMAMTPKEKMKNRDFSDAAILKIQSYQQYDGRFNYWSNGYYHAWSDLYAGHYLLEARDKNLLFKDDALRLWLKHKTNLANQWKMDISGTVNVSEYTITREETIQAYRLFFLAKAGKPAKSAMNRFRKRTLNAQITKILLAGAYYYTGMNEIGKELLDQALAQGSSDKISHYSYSFGSEIRNKAIAIYVLSLFERSEQLDAYYTDWVKEVNQKRWLSTQEQGFIFMACAAYFGEQLQVGENIDFELQSKRFNKRTKIPANQQRRYQWSWRNIGDEVTVKNHGQSTLYVMKTQRAISKELYQAAKASNLELSVNYTHLNGELVNLQNIKQGEEILISVIVQNKDILDQDNLALSVKMPSGWELLNPRLYSTNADEKAQFTFQDFRDDKVYTYFSLAKNGQRTYHFRAKANLTGDYFLPSVRCENMYRGNVYAYNKAERVVIRE